MAFNCNVAHTEPWDSRLVSAEADPGFNDGKIKFDAVVNGRFTGRHEDSNKSIEGLCQSTTPHIRFRRVVVEGGKKFTYIYQADVFQDDADAKFKTRNGRYEKHRGNVPLIARERPEVIESDDWIGERPIT